MTDSRPVNLNLFTIHLPITGLMSIAHRISGIIIFISLPIIIYTLDLFLNDKHHFQQFIKNHPFSLKIILIIVIWAITHHSLAGIRYLLLDLDIGFEKPLYRWSALIVLIGGVSALLFTALLILF